ncbi:aminoacyl--tRNA ligase-related protein [Micromonospora inyonensis]|uniref:tRNA synthetase class II core domain (G, H, P, S and T) n=1 Tax=Micromonospora inyonensis TaxID=47866 RepID=A0A1C6S7P8_9ACTN|nr:aminoacyl--tRNA ligase-related protein [Micromonospora inyonensis]SCL25318.1 tRNA synthetase class II core domain (G, H, P, S and T) [Micromonospora inyonensis]
MTTPSTFTVTFPQPLAAWHAEDLRRHVFYVAEEIKDFRLVRVREAAPVTAGGTEDISGVTITVTDPARADAVASKVLRLVADDIAHRREVPEKVVWRLPDRGRYPTGVVERLTGLDSVVPTAPGLASVSGPVLDLLEYFDAGFRAMARDVGAVGIRYPTLIPTEVIDRCGYVESFPQLLMFTTRLRGDIDNYRSFTERHGHGDVADRVLEHAGPADFCLPPAACFHVYHQFRGRTLVAGQAVVTTAAKVFRHESRYEDGLERLWDFTMREIVFIGDRDSVRERRRHLMETVREFLGRHALAGHCAVATDPFFVGADFAAKMTLQSLSESKYELQLNVDAERTIACGSFNYHDSFFTSRFTIGAASGEEMVTGCVAFGLERFAYAFLRQHGTEPAGWPPEVVAAL